MLELGIVIGIALYLAVLVRHSLFRVDEGYLAVLTSFGAPVYDGDKLRVYRPGLHRKAPWHNVHHVSMKEQSLELSGEAGGSQAMAADGTMLRLDSTLRYLPLESELERYLFALRRPIEHIMGLFTCVLRNEIANVGARSLRREAPASARMGEWKEHDDPLVRTADEESSYAVVRRERRELNRRIEEFCKARIGGRYGVRFRSVDLSDIIPPQELAEALNAVMNAKTEAETLLARAESECHQQVLAARRSVEIATARARAVEIEILEITRHLEELEKDGSLGMYVARRRAEVSGEARATFLKRQQ